VTERAQDRAGKRVRETGREKDVVHSRCWWKLRERERVEWKEERVWGVWGFSMTKQR